MAGLKTASGDDIDGSFELQVRVELEERDAVGQGGDVGHGAAAGQRRARLLGLRVTGELRVGELERSIAESFGEPQDWSDHALWWEQQRRWLRTPGPTLDSLGVGGGSRLLFAPRHRPLRLRLPAGGVLRLRLDFAGTPGRAAARVCGLLGVRHPEELSLLWPEAGEGPKGGAPPRAPPDLDLAHLGPRADEAPPPALPPELLRPLRSPKWGGRDPQGPPRSPPGSGLERRARLDGRWLDVGRSLLEQGVAEEQELLLRFKYPCAMGLDPQDSARLELLQEQALASLLAEEIDCTQEQAVTFAALQYQIEGEEWGEGGEPQEPPQDLETALERLELSLGGGGTPEPGELGAPPELEEELEIYRPSPWPFRGSRPTRALLSGSSLSLWTPPGSGGSPQQLDLRGCEVTPEVDLGAQKFGIRLRLPGGTSETLLRCRDPPQYARWFCGCRAASRGGSPTTAEIRGVLGVLGVLGVRPRGGDPPQTPCRPPPDPRRLLPPRFQRKMKAKEFTQQLLEVLQREGSLSPPQARLRFLEAWRALPGFGRGHFVVRFRGSASPEVLAVGPSQLLRIELGSGAVTRSWSFRDLRQWDVNWDSRQVRLWLSGDVTLGLQVLSAPPRALHQFLGGYLALGGLPRDPLELRRLMEGGYDP